MAVAPAAYDEPAPPPGLVPPPGGPPGPPGYTPPPPATGGGSKTALLAVFGFLAFCFVGIAAFVLLRAGDDDTAVSPAPPVATTQPFSPPAPPPTPAPTTTPAPPPPTTVTPTTVPPTTVPATTVPPPTTTVPPPTTTVPPSTTAAPSTETYAVVHGIIVMLDVPCDNLAAEGYDDVPTLQVDILDVDENFLINMPPGPLGAVDVDDGCAVRFEGVDLPRRDAYLVSTLERGQIEIFVEDFTNDDGVDTIFAVSLGG